MIFSVMTLIQRKIAVLGSRAVGKSSVTGQYIEGQFASTYNPTIENTFSRVTKYNGKEIETELIDTAGQDEYSIVNSRHAVGAHGFILVYSVTSKSSFEMLSIIRDKILSYTGTDWIPLVIVGNKADLTSQRQVSAASVAKVAAQWRCKAIEVSAKDNENIFAAIQMILDEIERALSRGICTRKRYNSGKEKKKKKEESIVSFYYDLQQRFVWHWSHQFNGSLLCRDKMTRARCGWHPFNRDNSLVFLCFFSLCSVALHSVQELLSALAVRDVLNSQIDTFRQDTVTNAFVHNHTHRSFGYIVNDSSFSVVELVRHSLVHGGICLDVDNVSNLVILEVSG